MKELMDDLGIEQHQCCDEKDGGGTSVTRLKKFCR